jgi:hypothetical protein
MKTSGRRVMYLPVGGNLSIPAENGHIGPRHAFSQAVAVVAQRQHLSFTPNIFSPFYLERSDYCGHGGNLNRKQTGKKKRAIKFTVLLVPNV